MARRDGERFARATITSGWYAANIGAGHLAVEDAIGGGAVARRLSRLRAVRGVMIYLAARRARGAALLRREPGALTVLALAAILGGPPVVILEMIPDRPPRAGWKRVIARLWFRLVERPAVRRGMRAGQVLSEVERSRLAQAYGVPGDRFRHVGWALCRTGSTPPRPAAERSGVISSGRAACDWETLFAAAAGRPWPLTVVCAEVDRARVEALNRSSRATVRCEIDRDEHDRLLEAAAVFAMPLVDDGLSSGQVRLMTATEIGTPVVASAVETLSEYVVGGETALTVPPGDPEALRDRIEALLADPDRRDALAAAALSRARSRTYADYFRSVGEMVEDEIAAG